MDRHLHISICINFFNWKYFESYIKGNWSSISQTFASSAVLQSESKTEGAEIAVTDFAQMQIRGKERKDGSSEDASSMKETREHQQPRSQHQSIVYPSPLEPFQDTVILKKPLGLRISKNTLQVKVTYIEESGASVGRVFVGDIIVAIDGEKISTVNELNCMLKKPSPVQMALRINEMVDVNEVLGLSVKYDAKERIQVNATAVDSLSSLHLRPGDIIREVNEYPVASKTMLDYFIQAGVIERGQVNFTIESSAGGIDAYRDQVDLANDVLEIAQKQIVQFRNAVAAKTLNRPSILRKQQADKDSKKIVISQNFVELPIGADYDPSKLKPCKGANVETRNMQKNDF
uniref:PDZ domain-containing protein n=1 Tax=Setaria digitata TaxID=48799 RepID=A0A915PU35_9BILA